MNRRLFIKAAAGGFIFGASASILADTEIPRGQSGCTEPPKTKPKIVSWDYYRADDHTPERYGKLFAEKWFDDA